MRGVSQGDGEAGQARGAVGCNVPFAVAVLGAPQGCVAAAKVVFPRYEKAPCVMVGIWRSCYAVGDTPGCHDAPQLRLVARKGRNTDPLGGVLAYTVGNPASEGHSGLLPGTGTLKAYPVRSKCWRYMARKCHAEAPERGFLFYRFIPPSRIDSTW